MMFPVESEGSPFLPGDDSPRTPPDGGDPPGSPFAAGYVPEEPFGARDEPRLGIIHLMGGITCAAVYLGLMRTALLALQGDAFENGEMRILLGGVWLFYGLGAGLALGGPLLWLARRIRGVRFPVHPGEYLLMVLGLNGILILGMFFLFALDPLWMPIASGLFLIRAALCLWAAIRVGPGRWRTFFFLGVLASLLCCGGVGFVVGGPLLAIVLAFIAARDHRQGLRYPWTHWLGVAIQMWSGLVILGMIAVVYLGALLIS